MMNNKSGRVILALLVGAIMVAPTVVAQGSTTQQSSQFTIDKVSALSGSVIPDVQPQQTTVDWTYTVTGRGGELGFAQTTATTLRWEKPDCTDTNVFVTGPLAQTVTLESTETEDTGSATFTVSATTDAPGEVQLTCTFTGKVDAVGQAVAESNPAEQDLIFSVAYFGLIQAKSAGRLKEAGPQQTISYDIEVSNFGNARTNVAFSLGGGDEAAAGKWKTILPEPLILESKVSGLGGDVQTATFQISTPFKNGWNNEDETFKIVLTPTSSKTGTEGGNPVEVNVLARVRGVYVPSLEPIMLVGAIIGAGMLARLRRDE